MKNADAPGALAPANADVASQTLAPTPNIEEAIVRLAELVTNLERRLARPPIPHSTAPAVPYIRRSPSLPKRFG